MELERGIEITSSFKKVVLVSLAIGWLLHWPMHAAGELDGSRHDAISQVAEVLQRAAVDSPQGHRQDLVQRNVHDIIFFLDQALKASENSDVAARQNHAKQALTLLQRSVTHGYFDAVKADPVLTMIRQLLSDRTG